MNKRTDPLIYAEQPTPAAVLASVPKPAEFANAEAELSALRERREILMGEIRQMSGANSLAWDANRSRNITALHEQRETIDEAIKAARRARAATLAPYAAKVTHAMAPVTRDAAERMLASISEFRAALDVLTEIASTSGPLMIRDLASAAEVPNVNFEILATIPFLDLRTLGALENFARKVLDGKQAARAVSNYEIYRVK